MKRAVTHNRSGSLLYQLIMIRINYISNMIHQKLVFMKYIFVNLLIVATSWITVALAVIIYIVDKYIFADWQFVFFLLVLISIDTFLGMVKALMIDKSFSSIGFSKLFLKCIVYSCYLITVHVLTHFTVDGEKNIAFSWIDDFAFSSIIAREAFSIIENIGLIYPKLVPDIIRRYLMKFQKNKPPDLNE